MFANRFFPVLFLGLGLFGLVTSASAAKPDGMGGGMGGGESGLSPLADVDVTGDLTGPLPDTEGIIEASRKTNRVVVNNLAGPRTLLDLTFFNDEFGGRGATCFSLLSGGALLIQPDSSDLDKAILSLVFWGVLDDGLATEVGYTLDLEGTFQNGWFIGMKTGVIQTSDSTEFEVGETLSAEFTSWTMSTSEGNGSNSPDACVGSGDLGESGVTASVTRTR